MTLKIECMTLGLAATNTYILGHDETKTAIVVDPAWDGDKIVSRAKENGWRVTSIWLTHAHFDHLGGAGEVADAFNPPPPVALHPEDYWLWREQGGARLFGMDIDPGPEPTIDFSAGQIIIAGETEFEVRYAPGHTPGHVMFYSETEKLLIAGDVIFYEGIGRTDLPGGEFRTLIDSINTQVFTLPDDTRILNGHGNETTVGHEREHNPFLN
ncbi:MAG: MBL fold metallo-hydrolase [Chloroflexota bacterium]